MLYTEINRVIPQGRLENLRLESSGIAQLEGWALGDLPTVSLALGDGSSVAAQRLFRVWRADVASAQRSSEHYSGFIYEFDLLPFSTRLAEIRVLVNGEPMATVAPRGPFVPAHYAHLFDEAKVLHREHIYGSGPPSPAASPETVAAVARLGRTTLDFGCGSGALLRELRQRDIQAFGLELERPELRAVAHADVAQFIDYYSGELPTRFADKEFPVVACTEVLEHIPDYGAALDEIFRIAGEYVVITVPDPSAIPALFRHFTVPWHMLESTHVNFFTQESLRQLLAGRCTDVTFARIGRFVVNRTHAFTSIVATCRL